MDKAHNIFQDLALDPREFDCPVFVVLTCVTSALTIVVLVLVLVLVLVVLVLVAVAVAVAVAVVVVVVVVITLQPLQRCKPRDLAMVAGSGLMISAASRRMGARALRLGPGGKGWKKM